MNKQIDYVYEHQLYFWTKFIQSSNKNIIWVVKMVYVERNRWKLWFNDEEYFVELCCGQKSESLKNLKVSSNYTNESNR